MWGTVYMFLLTLWNCSIKLRIIHVWYSPFAIWIKFESHCLWSFISYLYALNNNFSCGYLNFHIMFRLLLLLHYIIYFLYEELSLTFMRSGISKISIDSLAAPNDPHSLIFTLLCNLSPWMEFCGLLLSC